MSLPKLDLGEILERVREDWSLSLRMPPNLTVEELEKQLVAGVPVYLQVVDRTLCIPTDGVLRLR